VPKKNPQKAKAWLLEDLYALPESDFPYLPEKSDRITKDFNALGRLNILSFIFFVKIFLESRRPTPFRRP